MILFYIILMILFLSKRIWREGEVKRAKEKERRRDIGGLRERKKHRGIEGGEREG